MGSAPSTDHGIVRQEMDKIGQEFYLPAIHPRELWSQRALAVMVTLFPAERPQGSRSVSRHDA